MSKSSNSLSLKNSGQFSLTNQRRNVWLVSIFAILLALSGLLFSYLGTPIGLPLRPGLDFTGGTQIRLDRVCKKECEAINVSSITKSLLEFSFPRGENLAKRGLSEVKVQLLDQSQSLVVRLPFLSASEVEDVIEALDSIAGPFSENDKSVDTIGPILGGQLLRSSLISLLVAFSGISLYIGLRYDKVYALLALIAVGHDVLIVCGVFAWLGIFLSVEVDSLFAVSLLTIAGYSVNDTVVVFDRIREQVKEKRFSSLSQRIDYAVSATLTRTIYTSCTTLLPLLALIFFGGSTLFWFSLSLALGIVVGSWSSIALAPSLLSLREPVVNKVRLLNNDLDEGFEESD